jgi:hypothetical protein
VLLFMLPASGIVKYKSENSHRHDLLSQAEG